MRAAALLVLLAAAPAAADDDDDNWTPPHAPDTGPGAALSDAPCKGDCVRAPGYLALDRTPGNTVARAVPVYRDHGAWVTYRGKVTKPAIVWRTVPATAAAARDSRMLAAVIAPDAAHLAAGRLPTSERDAMTATYLVYAFHDVDGASLVASCHVDVPCNTKLPVAPARLLVGAEN